jgi:hypothetical protein
MQRCSDRLTAYKVLSIISVYKFQNTYLPFFQMRIQYIQQKHLSFPKVNTHYTSLQDMLDKKIYKKIATAFP